MIPDSYRHERETIKLLGTDDPCHDEARLVDKVVIFVIVLKIHHEVEALKAIQKCLFGMRAHIIGYRHDYAGSYSVFRGRNPISS
jgi:hypothetical protein